MTIEITDYDMPRQFTSSIRSTAMDVHGVLTFRPAHAGTIAQWSWDMQPRGRMRLIGPLVRYLGGRMERRVWVDLKRHLEQQAPVAEVDGRRQETSHR